jgi:putative ABC transport system permease protein
LAKSPAFTSIAVMVLALGIGANTAIFTVVNATLLRDLPFPDPAKLLVIAERNAAGTQIPVAYPNFLDWQNQATSFSSLAAFRTDDFNLTNLGEPERLSGRWVTASFFQALGLNSALGRLFTAEDDHPGAPPTVLLSDALWRRRFAGDPASIGRQITLDGRSYTVIGVLPPAFAALQQDDVVLPLGLMAGGANFLNRANRPRILGLGRLKPDVSITKARAEMETIARRLEAAYPATNRGLGVVVDTLQNRLTGTLRTPMLVLFAAVGLVLLIACVNVAHLLLVRAAGREREIAVRTALGASRSRLVRQLMVECSVLGAAGGLAGLLLTVWGLDLILAAAPEQVQSLKGLRPDTLVFAFTAGISLFTAVLVGLFPALISTKRDPARALSLRGANTEPRVARLRAVLLIGQLALAVTLLSGAGLMIRAFANLYAVDPGFDTSRLLTLNFSLSGSRYSDPVSVIAFQRSVLERVEALPGVESVALTNSLPLAELSGAGEVTVDGFEAPLTAAYLPVSAGYFRTLRIPLIHGRQFTEDDRTNSPPVAIINDDMARRYWPGEIPIGKRLKYGSAGSLLPWREVVGVVGDVRMNGLDAEPGQQIYVPIAQEPKRSLKMAVRTAYASRAMTESIARVIYALDSTIPLHNIRTVEQAIDRSLSNRRFAMLLLAAFAGLALILATVGIYGGVSNTVAQRTQEIGVRVALGAGPGDIMRTVIAPAMMLVAAGVGFGAMGALALARGMTGLLFGVKPWDAATLASVSVILGVSALVACVMPVRRALQVDAIEALRRE